MNARQRIGAEEVRALALSRCDSGPWGECEGFARELPSASNSHHGRHEAYFGPKIDGRPAAKHPESRLVFRKSVGGTIRWNLVEVIAKGGDIESPEVEQEWLETGYHTAYHDFVATFALLQSPGLDRLHSGYLVAS